MQVQQLIFIATILVVIPSPIWANIKDFIIENESDLQRLGLADADQQYEDAFDSDWMPDSCGVGGGGHPFSEYMGNNDEEMVYDLSQLDPRLLREILQQMKYDPRFEHLWEHLTEENILSGRLMSHAGEDDEDKEREDFYVDMDESYQGGDNYEIE
uniref:Uncharacterized protein n=1 Tax=Stomoxys calcitrans TaxID=35570 RepID=A0A1I8P4F4_STOCA